MYLKVNNALGLGVGKGVDATTVSKVLHEQGHNEARMLAVGRCPGWPDLWHLNCSIRIRIRIRMYERIDACTIFTRVFACFGSR